MPRVRYVWRCDSCDGVQHPPGERLISCPRCQQPRFGPVDASRAPELAPQHVPVVGDSHYDGLQATDGTPIDTRAKHRAYMKANGLTTMDDFTNTWAKAAADRAAGPSPAERRQRREQIGRNAYRLRQKARR